MPYIHDDVLQSLATLPDITDTAQVGVQLVALWPLTDVKQLDNDAKYAENLQVRITRVAATILTDDDVTIADAEFVYEGADEIPGRSQHIVDALLAANDAYDIMESYARTFDSTLIEQAAQTLGFTYDPATLQSIMSIIEETTAFLTTLGIRIDSADSIETEEDSTVSAPDSDDVANTAIEQSPVEVTPQLLANRLALVILLCDTLMTQIANCAHVTAQQQRAAHYALPLIMYINEVCEIISIPRLFLTSRHIATLIAGHKNATDVAATASHTAQFLSTIISSEWNKHRDDVLWDRAEAKKRAREEDEKKNKEALAAKFAHIKDDPSKPAVEL